MTTPESNSTEIILLGTGASSSVPHVECLTALPGQRTCKTCHSALTPQGKKNKRRNTSCAIRMTAKDGRKVCVAGDVYVRRVARSLNRTIVIDAGKNFQAAALEWFPKYGLRRIDALLISHAHADAIYGLDDLRSWTLNNNIQTHIDVYVSQDTLAVVKQAFPYLVSKDFASGSGRVADFRWHIINDAVPFEIQDTGIWVVPFSVHHGRMPPKASPFVNATDTSGTLSKADAAQPYVCYAFKVENKVVYMSDVSHIPDDKWRMIESEGNSRQLPVLVLDCLRLVPQISHIGIEYAVETARRVKATRTYLTGMGHEVMHEEYVAIGEVIGGAMKEGEEMSEITRKGLGLIKNGEKIWVRPGHDGLRVLVDENSGFVCDNTY